MTTLQSTIVVPEDVLFHELSGEAVLLNLTTGKYYGLDEVGTRMWQLILDQAKLESAYKILLDEYEVDEEQLASDLIHLIDSLAEQGLISVETPAEIS